MKEEMSILLKDQAASRDLTAQEQNITSLSFRQSRICILHHGKSVLVIILPFRRYWAESDDSKMGRIALISRTQW